MNIRIASALLLAVVSVSCSAEQTLTFKNKTDFSIGVAVGWNAHPPHKFIFGGKAEFQLEMGNINNFWMVRPQDERALRFFVDDNHIQIMFWKNDDSILVWKPGSTELVYLYEVTQIPGKKFAVQVTVDPNGDMKLSSIPFTFNTTTQNDIAFMGIINLNEKFAQYNAKKAQSTSSSSSSSKKSSAKKVSYTPRQKALQTLGFEPDAAPNENEIKKAYHKLALTMHPDKVSVEQRAEATEKFKVIQNAYELLTNK